MAARAARFIVHGRVQGVGFRYSAQRKAARLELTGWVRNNPDGTVEAVAEGTPEALVGFERWLRSGPIGARVDRVESTPLSPHGLYRRFSIEH